MKFNLIKASDVNNGIFYNNKYYKRKPYENAFPVGPQIVSTINSKTIYYAQKWEIEFTTLNELLSFIDNVNEKVLIDNFAKTVTICDELHVE